VAGRSADIRSQSGAGDLTDTELRQEVLKLRRRVEKLAALLRLTLALLHTSGFGLCMANCKILRDSAIHHEHDPVPRGANPPTRRADRVSSRLGGLLNYYPRPAA
jgi:hypothetical protein